MLHSRAAISAAAALAAASCSPIGTGPDGDGPAHVHLAIATSGTRGDRLDAVHLDVAKVVAGVDGATAPADRGPCGALGDALDVSATVDVDLHRDGGSQVGVFDVAAGDLGELRLLLRADVDDGGRRRHARGRLTCLDGDGTELVVVRLVPTAPISLEHDQDEDLVAILDANGGVEEEACADGDDGCDLDDGQDALVADHGGGDGGSGGGGGGGGHGGGGDDQGGGHGGGGGDDQGGGGGGGGAGGGRGGDGGGGRGGNQGGGGDDGGGDHGGGGGGDDGGGGGGDGGGQHGPARGSRILIAAQLPLSRAP